MAAPYTKTAAMKLKDKAIIVTGSTMGIGEAIARRCVAEGARVLVHGLERGLGEALCAELGSASAALHIDDLADAAAPARVVAAAIDAFGKIDGLVNNAAVVAQGNLEDTDAEAFDRILGVNTRAPLFLIKAALPHLEKSRGAVVNIGSVNAHCGEENLLPYSISKGALQTLTRNLGDTLHRRGIRVNQINPGWVLTRQEHQRRMDQGMEDDWPTRIPIAFSPTRRLIKPEEIAATVAHFLSEEFGPISGAVIDLEQYPMIGRNPLKQLE
jgi:NAD(P)-dependent dehydrogenase (short-subunit alcohol dehydrogenase family)